MKNLKNRSFWFWGFILLLILNISIVSSLSYFHYQMKHHHGKRYKTMINHKKNIRENSKLHKEFWGNVSFTKEERNFLQKSRKEHFSKMKKLSTELKQNQSTLFDEVRKSKPDSTLISKYKSKVLESQEAITNEAIFFYENLKTKLSNEQMQTINKHLTKRFHSKRENRNNNN